MTCVPALPPEESLEDLVYATFDIPRLLRVYPATGIGNIQLVGEDRTSLLDTDERKESLPPLSHISSSDQMPGGRNSTAAPAGDDKNNLHTATSPPPSPCTASWDLIPALADTAPDGQKSPNFKQNSDRQTSRQSSERHSPVLPLLTELSRVARVTFSPGTAPPSSPANKPIVLSSEGAASTQPLTAVQSGISASTVQSSILPNQPLKISRQSRAVRLSRRRTESEEEELYWTTSVQVDDWIDVTISEWCDIAGQLQRNLPNSQVSAEENVTEEIPTGECSERAKQGSLSESGNLLSESDIMPDSSLHRQSDPQAISNILQKVDPDTVDEIVKVYLPAFEVDPLLVVQSDAYYESEPDTLSCCSESPDVAAEDRIEQTAWDINLPEIFEMLQMNVKHVTDYAVLNRNTMHAIAISKSLLTFKEDLFRLMRCLGQLTDPTALSSVVQAAREIYIPFGKKVYVTSRLDMQAVYARTTEDAYDGFVARPVFGLWIFCFYDAHCHPVVTIDVVNSLVDYLNFCVFSCLPEYEDGFEKDIALVLDRQDGKKHKSRHEKEAFTSQEIFRLPTEVQIQLD